ncbi:HAD family hydrolase [Omnitrophica bacterium]|nr:HAD family hydrolase [Candidatus Omnitrophota bacterium]
MKIIFIDRDGVINKDPGGWTEHSYVTSWKDFHFLPGAKESLKKLTEAGYEIIIISNQAGVNRGYFTQNDLRDINENMLKEIYSSGGRVHSTYYCPHTKDEGCDCRKPKTGLFKKATEDLDVDFKGTFFIGDGSMDVEAGKRIGCRTILLLSGKSKLEDVEGWICKPDYIKKDLLEAVDWILSER